ncbi:MAG: MFS transporter [Steroidobacteraceae bacterium]
MNELWSRRGILLATMAGVGLSIATIPPYVLSVFARPMTQELGWSMQAYQTVNLLIPLGIMFASPLGGYLVDRYGPRRVALIGIMTFSLGIAAFSLVTASPWTFYFCMFPLVLLACGILPITWTRLVNTHFLRQRGAALGLTLSGSGVAAIFLPSLTQTVIDAAGWRSAWLVLAALPVLIAWPLAWWFVRDERAHHGEPASKHVAANAAMWGRTLGEALRSRQFWLLAGSLCAISVCLGAWTANLVPVLMTKDLDAPAAARLAGVLGISVIFGRIGAGMLLDRFWAPAINSMIFLLPIIGFNMLYIVEPQIWQLALAVILCGIAAGAEYDFLAYFLARYFGLAHYGKIFAMIILPVSLATSAGAMIGGRVLDATGSLNAAVPAFTIATLIAAALPLALGRYPQQPT